jgi:hypothetical protein
MKFAFIVPVLALSALVCAPAQELKMPPGLEKLAEKATETVDVTMDQSLLQLASRFLSDKDPDEARVKRLVAGLKSIYVKSFEFDSAGEYQESDVAAIRAQLKPPVWSRVVGVRSKKDGENAEVFIASDAAQVTGLAVIAAEPKQLTIVHIVGQIRPEDLRELGGNFGIPKFEVGKHKTEAKED